MGTCTSQSGTSAVAAPGTRGVRTRVAAGRGPGAMWEGGLQMSPGQPHSQKTLASGDVGTLCKIFVTGFSANLNNLKIQSVFRDLETSSRQAPAGLAPPPQTQASRPGSQHGHPTGLLRGSSQQGVRPGRHAPSVSTPRMLQLCLPPTVGFREDATSRRTRAGQIAPAPEGRLTSLRPVQTGPLAHRPGCWPAAAHATREALREMPQRLPGPAGGLKNTELP